MWPSLEEVPKGHAAGQYGNQPLLSWGEYDHLSSMFVFFCFLTFFQVDNIKKYLIVKLMADCRLCSADLHTWPEITTTTAITTTITATTTNAQTFTQSRLAKF